MLLVDLFVSDARRHVVVLADAARAAGRGVRDARDDARTQPVEAFYGMVVDDMLADTPRVHELRRRLADAVLFARLPAPPAASSAARRSC